MDATIKMLDPWWRELRGVLEAVATSDEASSIVDTWELRVLLPRPSKYSLQQWGRRARTASSDHVKLQRIREALELLWLVRAIDEKAWTYVLVHRCGVGGFDVPSWTDDARVLPVLRIQLHLVDASGDVIDAFEQCRHLLVTLQDETKLSTDFNKFKRQLSIIATAAKTARPHVAYTVRLSNWMSPNTQLSAAESTQMWTTLSMIVREMTSASLPDSAVPLWQLASLDLHLLRSVVTFDAAVALLELMRSGVGIGELWIDLLDRADDELTAVGFAALLIKLVNEPSSRPRLLRVECENASVERLQRLTHVLQAASSPIAVAFERFGLSSITGITTRPELFELLGVCLRQRSVQSLTLDVPEFSAKELATMAAAFTSAERSMGLSSLHLTTDCRRDSWVVVEKLLHLVGKSLTSLEVGINGDVLSEKASKAILSLCPRLEHLTLHRLQLGKRDPLVAYLAQPTSLLRSLVLPRLHTSLPVIGQISRTIADRTLLSRLESLHLDLSDMTNVCDEVVSGFSSALCGPSSLRALTMVLDSDAAAALSDPVHDDFYRLHNQRVHEPLARRATLAFLSVVASPTRTEFALSRLPQARILQFAGSQWRRRVSIREPGMPW